MSEPRYRLPLEELKATPEYKALTPKQKLFVATYVQGGIDTGEYDPVNAAITAYRCKNKETARVMSYSLMASINIIEALNRHFNRDPIEEFLAILNRAIHNKNLTLAQLGALRLKCAILGIDNKIPNVPADSQNTGTVQEEKPRKKKAPEPETPQVTPYKPAGNWKA